MSNHFEEDLHSISLPHTLTVISIIQTTDVCNPSMRLAHSIGAHLISDGKKGKSPLFGGLPFFIFAKELGIL
jgi:hypothetical protein